MGTSSYRILQYLGWVRGVLLEDLFEGSEKWREVLDDRLPDYLHVYVEISMDESVAHAG